MSFSKTVTIWCDMQGCGRGFRLPARTKATVAQVRTQAAAHGWTYVVGVVSDTGYSAPKDFCDKHFPMRQA